MSQVTLLWQTQISQMKATVYEILGEISEISVIPTVFLSICVRELLNSESSCKYYSHRAGTALHIFT